MICEESNLKWRFVRDYFSQFVCLSVTKYYTEWVCIQLSNDGSISTACVIQNSVKPVSVFFLSCNYHITYGRFWILKRTENMLTLRFKLLTSSLLSMSSASSLISLSASSRMFVVTGSSKRGFFASCCVSLSCGLFSAWVSPAVLPIFGQIINSSAVKTHRFIPQDF